MVEYRLINHETGKTIAVTYNEQLAEKQAHEYAKNTGIYTNLEAYENGKFVYSGNSHNYIGKNRIAN